MGSLLSSLCYILLPSWSLSLGNSDDKDQYVDTIVAAVEKGDIEGLREVLESPKFKNFGSIENIETVPSLIQRAAAREYDHIVKFLIERSVNVDQADSCDMTALHEACKKRNFRSVLELVSHSKNIDKRDIWGRTPLIKALVYRNERAAKLLLEKGANPNAIDIYGMTPLSTAIDYNMIDMIRLLVNYGADINMVTVHQWNKCSGPPLYQAVINQNIDIVNELVYLGGLTRPRPQDFCPAYGYAKVSPKSGPQPTLTHENAVILAMSELVKRNSLDILGPGMDILMALIAAHGHSLGSSSDVLIRVLINSRPEEFPMILHKLQLCSSSSQDELLGTSNGTNNTQRHAARSQHMQQLDHHLQTSDGKRASYQVMSLQNQARRVARCAMMCSGHNVVWATHRLQCPPALKSLLLLKDIDRAFSTGPDRLKST
ncbi:tankyrase-2 [Biomphalaria glabrata]|uniref:Poly [ADP-ribose] polymerase tankyrase-2-like n=1 Tax=Biomphalaria glabrata TaxID=6526 RepID=A0A9U8EGE2_BIOGL|nr:poly [ADP-ribose] polymerase tankyrase-2-like [Biomphalaria glabrata]KAI8733494.1 tankyrase-2-like [Biomphalaria glabrata]